MWGASPFGHPDRATSKRRRPQSRAFITDIVSRCIAAMAMPTQKERRFHIVPEGWPPSPSILTRTTVAAFGDDDLAKTIDRGGFGWSVETQLEVYLQALLIFFGKITIYLKALGKPLPKEFQDYIG
jgi:hypothetical protein